MALDASAEDRESLGAAGSRSGQEDQARTRASRLGGAPRVDFDDEVIIRVRVQRILDVALADNAEVPDDFHGRVAQHVVVVVVERLAAPSTSAADAL